MQALVRVPLCPLLCRPEGQAPRADEVFCGDTITLLEETNGWYYVKTACRYTGYAPAHALLRDADAPARWQERPKQVVLQAVCDVLSAPRVDAPCVLTLLRGALVSPVGAPDGDGWQKITLCDGRAGFMKTGFLGTYYSAPAFAEEGALRAAIVRTARSYLGVQYRWGGKSPLGIDCSGLAAMAYWLNGVCIYRDAELKAGFPLHAIARAALKPADLLFFPGHVAIYLGDDRYLHATAHNGSDGVVENSLNPAHSDYRADLPGKITALGSYFADTP